VGQQQTPTTGITVIIDMLLALYARLKKVVTL
jgi:hypothetical protein